MVPSIFNIKRSIGFLTNPSRCNVNLEKKEKNTSVNHEIPQIIMKKRWKHSRIIHGVRDRRASHVQIGSIDDELSDGSDDGE